MLQAIIALVGAVITESPEIIKDIEQLIADFRGSPAGVSWAQRSASVTAELKSIAGE